VKAPLEGELHTRMARATLARTSSGSQWALLDDGQRAFMLADAAAALEALDEIARNTVSLCDRIRHVAKGLGWAVGEHGSMRRDIDLIATPWRHAATAPRMLVWAICEACDLQREDEVLKRTVRDDGSPYEYPQRLPYNRLGYVLLPRWRRQGEPRAVDLSLVGWPKMEEGKTEWL